MNPVPLVSLRKVDPLAIVSLPHKSRLHRGHSLPAPLSGKRPALEQRTVLPQGAEVRRRAVLGHPHESCPLRRPPLRPETTPPPAAAAQTPTKPPPAPTSTTPSPPGQNGSPAPGSSRPPRSPTPAAPPAAPTKTPPATRPPNTAALRPALLSTAAAPPRTPLPHPCETATGHSPPGSATASANSGIGSGSRPIRTLHSRRRVKVPAVKTRPSPSVCQLG